MKIFALVIILVAMLSCKKAKETEQPPTQIIKPLTETEMKLVGKWKYIKTENYDSNGSIMSTSIPSGVDTNTFINLTSSTQGSYVTVYDNQHYTQYYGVTGQGASDEWFLGSTVAGKQELYCYLYPSPKQSAFFYIDTIAPNLLVVDNFTTTIPFGKRVYYFK